MTALQNAIRLPFPGASAEALEWKSTVCKVTRLPRYVTAETCRRIVEVADKFADEPGEMFEGRSGKRRNRVRWLQLCDESRWVFDLMAHLLTDANRDYRFDLTGFAEPVHVVEYRASDHIDWHLDCALKQTSTRKLVGTILLSDPATFSGGELEISAMDSHLKPEGIGEATVFPAFLSHRVLPVTSGRRRVLVGWAHGPAFR